MSAEEQSGWRDNALAARHKIWALNCPAVDLDLLFAEYDSAIAKCLVEYRLYDMPEPDLGHPTYKAISHLSTSLGLPFFVAKYWPGIWGIRVDAINDNAREFLGCERKDMTEIEFNWLLVTVRGHRYWHPKTDTSIFLHKLPPKPEKYEAYQTFLETETEWMRHILGKNNCRPVSLRHRIWDDNCPCVDLDFLLIEYNLGLPVALAEFKKHTAKDQKLYDSNYRTLIGLADRAGLPFFVVMYWPEVWAFRVFSINEHSKKYFPGLVTDLSEMEFVSKLHEMRAVTVKDLVLNKLHSSRPPVSILV